MTSLIESRCWNAFDSNQGKSSSEEYSSLNTSDGFLCTNPPAIRINDSICTRSSVPFATKYNFDDSPNTDEKEEKLFEDADKNLDNSASDLLNYLNNIPDSLNANCSNLTLPPKTIPLSSNTETDNVQTIEETNLLTRLKKSLTRFSRKQWFTILGVCYVNCASNASLSILSSFFSKEAITNHGVSEFVVGLIFGCYAMVNTIFCPIYGKLVPKVGPKRMLMAGLLVSSVCSFSFSLESSAPTDGVMVDKDSGDYKPVDKWVSTDTKSQLYRCTTTLSFVAGCFVVRATQALGCAAYYTGATVTIAQVWRNDLAFAMGLGEVFSGIGMITGPLIGGYLYQEGGFQLPFIVVGGVMMIGLCVNYFAAINVETTPTVGKFSTLIRIPNVTFTALFACVMLASLDFNMPILSLHMQSLHDNSPVLVGTMFLIMAVAYTISAPLVGIVSKTKIVERSFMVAGGFIVSLSFLLLGPSPIFFPFNFNQPSVVSIALSMGIFGVGMSAALVPTFSNLKRSAVAGGMANDISTSGLVGGLFNGVTFFGEFIGPVIAGGLMNELHDYKIVSSIFASIVLFIVSGITLFYLHDWRKSNSIDPIDAEIKEADENTPLINPSA